MDIPDTPLPTGPSQPVPSSSLLVEYKKDGSVSRMRAHKGNIPQLPQTKLCPFCPARFTRTTHLNRHLRNRESFGLLQLSCMHLMKTQTQMNGCIVVMSVFVLSYSRRSHSVIGY
jgi:hypothetical protein